MRYGAEIKVTFSADQAANAATKFRLRERRAEPLVIYFLDSLDAAKNPTLLGHGVVLRMRDRAGGAGDCTAKLRPVDEGQLSGRWLPETNQDNDYRVEYDWASRPVLSASLSDKLEADRLTAVLSGARLPKHALTERQRKFLRACGPGLDSPFHGLQLAGPIAALRWVNIEWAGSDTLRAEQWTWGNGNLFLEFSIRVDNVAHAQERRARLAAEFERRNVKPDAATMTKTEAVLRDLLGAAPAHSNQ